ncbi:hypothetical protein B0H21DRAFT_725996 [Amylocystis lapponica]|nr:hypothetical protein B0H21DRAFT_725996 [Amylocystis lapponica]
MAHTTIQDLPPELMEQIILELDPLHVASFAQTCSAVRALIYDPPDQHLWRSLYLAQPGDDPRSCLDALGNPLPEPNWCARVQRITRARTLIRDWTKHRPGELADVLHTLLELVCATPPTPGVYTDHLSLNLVWAAALLTDGAFLDRIAPALAPAEQQLHAQLHTMFGLTAADHTRAARTRSRAFVYALRHYRWDNDFGPFARDGSGRVDWVHVQAVHHVMAMHVVPPAGAPPDGAFTIFPMSLPYCQSVIPRGVALDAARDWAGVAGLWQCSFCFCDHRELLIYNAFNLSDTGPLRPAIFDDPGFVEVFRSISIELRVIGTEPDPAHPTRPVIRFAGEVDQHATVVGWVKVTPDNQIRWHYKSGELGTAIWSSEGVQVAGVRSTFGVLGTWTTVHHDRHDPVGPFWLRKVHPLPDDWRGSA